MAVMLLEGAMLLALAARLTRKRLA
jgi:hypothetical protein